MELLNTHITFTIDELREAIIGKTIDDMLIKIGELMEYGYSVSVHTRHGGDIDFDNIKQLKRYLGTIHWDKENLPQA
jgi:hypothetical protein